MNDNRDFRWYSRILIITLTLPSLILGSIVTAFFVDKDITSYFTILIGLFAGASAFAGVMYSKEREWFSKKAELDHDFNKVKRQILAEAYIDAEIFKTVVMDVFEDVFQHSTKKLYYNLMAEMLNIEDNLKTGHLSESFKYRFNISRDNMISSRESWHENRAKQIHLSAKLHRFRYVENIGGLSEYEELMKEADVIMSMCDQMNAECNSFSNKARSVLKNASQNAALTKKTKRTQAVQRNVLKDALIDAYEDVLANIHDIYRQEMNRGAHSFYDLIDKTRKFKISIEP